MSPKFNLTRSEIVYQPLTLCPSPLHKGRGSVGKRGASPLSKISSPSPFKERGIKESQREAKPLLYSSLPLPLDKGKGIKGDRVTKEELKGGEVNKQSPSLST